MSRRRPLIGELVRRGLAVDESQARALVGDNRIVVNGAPVSSVERLVASGDDLRVVPERRFVSRGGDKLEGLLETLDLDIRGLVVVDLGASTGGFTDCLLQRGAAKVVAVDVGRGLLHPRIAADPRVVVCEGTDARDLARRDEFRGVADLVVADLSFISLRVVAGAILELVRPGGRVVCLVKPQFEATRGEASRGNGVIRDESVRSRVVEEVREEMVARGLEILETLESAVPGRSGNREVFLVARLPER